MFSLQASPEGKGSASTLSRPKIYLWVTIIPTRPCAIVGSGCANTVPRKEPCSFHSLNALLHEGLESVILLMSEVRKMLDKDFTAPRNKCFVSGRSQIRILTL
jgi:hypothetical protein